MSYAARVLSLLLLSVLLLSSCAGLEGSMAGPGPSKVDQLFGIALTYQAGAQDAAARTDALQAALEVLDVSLASLEAVVPTGTGLLLAAQLVEEHPSLVPYKDLVAKLYTVAVYGLATTAAGNRTLPGGVGPLGAVGVSPAPAAPARTEV